MPLFGDALFFGRLESMGCYFPESPLKPPWLKPMDYLIPPFPIWLSIWSKVAKHIKSVMILKAGPAIC